MHSGLMVTSAVATLLRVLQRRFDDGDARDGFVDFIVDSESGKPFGLYLVDDVPDPATTDKIRAALAKHPGTWSAYYCVTAAPTPKEAERFAAALASAGVPARLAAITELPALLGQDYALDVSTQEGLRDVRLASFVTNLMKHDLVDAAELDAGGPRKRLANLIAYGRTKVPADYHVLTRQFPHATVGQLLAGGGDLRSKLGIGTNVRPVTVVFSDLKNFSKLVHAVHPAALNEIMGRYYLLARELVWRHHGVLDKFIGDAVLAIFNYPQGDRVGEENAIRFALDLIELGREITGELLATINDVIESGTRVGIASGELWTIDIGYEEREVSFVGDVINLAARLEAAADVNGILLDNITYNLVKKRSPDFLAGLSPTEDQLGVDRVKGQANPIRAWRILVPAAAGGP